jgi:hypothetical protein
LSSKSVTESTHFLTMQYSYPDKYCMLILKRKRLELICHGQFTSLALAPALGICQYFRQPVSL